MVVQPKVGWLCWGLTSLSTIFQSCRDGAIASWVINQYFRGVKCLAQGHNTAEVGLEPRTSRSAVRHSSSQRYFSFFHHMTTTTECKDLGLRECVCISSLSFLGNQSKIINFYSHSYIFLDCNWLICLFHIHTNKTKILALLSKTKKTLVSN